jgi:galactokinase
LNETITASAPGRVCLFGEHQDYLGLSVISMAVNLRMVITGKARANGLYHIDMPDIQSFDEFPPHEELPYKHKRDYLRSVVNVLRRKGLKFEEGYDFRIKSDIPMNAGVASSSAFTVVWTVTVLKANGALDRFTGQELVHLAHEAEVLEFKEPGGIMDHFTATMGGLLHIDCMEPTRVTQLPRPLHGIVLGNSLEKKPTTSTLGSVKGEVRTAIELMRALLPSFDIRTTPIEEVIPLLRRLPEGIGQKLYANLVNRDICRRALELLQRPAFDESEMGNLLDDHHEMLRDYIGVSTPKIERMIAAAKEAGALGCKINGSGCGGTMIAYAPRCEEAVASAIEQAGGRSYIVKKSEGVRVE